MTSRGIKGKKQGKADIVVIRPARKEDCKAILGLWQEMMTFHAAREPFFTISEQGPDNFLKWIRGAVGKKGIRLSVAEVGREPAGYSLSVLTRYPPVFTRDWYCEIHDLAVAGQHRSKGVGRALLQDVREWAAAEGVTRIEARVAVANEVSTRFWRAMGLRPYMESLYLEL